MCATCTITGDRKGRHVGRDHQLCAITTASDRSKCTAPEAYSSSELPCIHYILSNFSCTGIYHHIANTSLQFLSMKLAAVNPRPEFNFDNFLNKEVG